ncbi:MAG: hypothetical protein Q8942_12465 [Bacillota bacterium]|nr:hypothetical protein [Bacillota bacterium]
MKSIKLPEESDFLFSLTKIQRFLETGIGPSPSFSVSDGSVS